MRFNPKKLPEKLADELPKVPLAELRPYKPIVAPAYIYLKSNAKLISIKSPLDFFTPEEIQKILPNENIYFPSFVTAFEPFQEIGKKARELIDGSKKMKITRVDQQGNSTDVAEIDMSPFEISDLVLKELGVLWLAYKGNPGIEPYFAAIATFEICDPISSEKLIRAKEFSVKNYETSLILSGWVVFLLLHLGYCNIAFLNDVRNRVFEDSYEKGDITSLEPEVRELIQLAQGVSENDFTKVVAAKIFKNRPEKVSQKIDSRLDRVIKEIMDNKKSGLRIYGEQGLFDGTESD